MIPLPEGCRYGWHRWPNIDADHGVEFGFGQPLGDRFSHKGNFYILSRFRLTNNQLSVSNIRCPEIQDLAHSHATPCLKFQNQPVTDLFAPINDFINTFSAEDVLLFHSWAFKSFDHDLILARILHGMSFFIDQEIEECFQLGIS